jgi:trimethylamine---corrinoid protein Co-methyltransferase
VEDCLKTVPSAFTLHARNPENAIRLGGDAMVFGNVSSPPNCSDADGGRRPGSLADFRNFSS